MSKFRIGDLVRIQNPYATDPRWQTGTGLIVGNMRGPSDFYEVWHIENKGKGGYVEEHLSRIAMFEGVVFGE